MLKKRNRKLEGKSLHVYSKKMVKKNSTESSSDEDEKNPYMDLVSIVSKKEVETDTDSDEDYPEKKRQRKLTLKTPALHHRKKKDTGSNESYEEDSGSESDLLLDEEQQEHDDKNTNEFAVMIFGESDSDENSDKKTRHSDSDFYKLHFEEIIPNNCEEVCKPKLMETLHWKTIGAIKHTRRREQNYALPKSAERNIQPESLRNIYHVRNLLCENWNHIKNDRLKTSSSAELFCPLQNELFTMFNSYIDVCYNSSKLLENSSDMQAIYCLHASNHVLRARAKVLLNTSRIKQMTLEQQEQADYRDQGITRPKVLILLPFKNSALKVINMLLDLLHRGDKFEVGRKKRFQVEFTKGEEDDAECAASAFMKKPEDYQSLFAGNTDEHFRIGISLLRNSVRLYSPFYSSDIIVASPLGLRTIIGSEKENHYEHDFLSSIEILIMDHADVFLMQNWEHVLHIMKHMNLTPKESHGVDFSRVKNYSLDGQNKFYRQTITLSNETLPQISALFTKFCFNFQGCFTIENACERGSICSVAKQLPQVFHKLSPATLIDAADTRFRFFVQQIYRQYKDQSMSHTLVFVPQYYDFVRLRNFMRKEWKNGSGPIFGHINDYSSSAEAGKAKRRFFTGKCPILLYTERFHFYNRTRIRGVRHLVFYELPTYPHFYAEICNMMRDTQQSVSVGSSGSVITIYTKYDARKLAAVVGANRSKELQVSQKNVHMFVTGAGDM